MSQVKSKKKVSMTVAIHFAITMIAFLGIATTSLIFAQPCQDNHDCGVDQECNSSGVCENIPVPECEVRADCNGGNLCLQNECVPNDLGFLLSSPEGIQAFLEQNSDVDSAAKFLERLPDEYKQHWMMMTRTESAQKGTATSPRFILPSKDASRVFGFALGSNTIEYLQFEETEKNTFRFHEIQMESRRVVPDKTGCQLCHGGNLNTGLGGRPNWDSYDSWGGMLPFNRDRIYENSEEAVAIKRLFMALEKDPIFEKLEPPKGINRDPSTGEIDFTFDKPDSGTGAMTCDSDANGTNDRNTAVVFFKRDAEALVSYPGEESVCVTQGGRYLTLHHSRTDNPGCNPDNPGPGCDPDEGRGVALFDQFSMFNAKRIAQELLDYQGAVDIRPIALAIARRCKNLEDHRNYAPQEALDGLAKFHEMNSENNGVKSFADLVEDTSKRRKSLPQMKANLQARNLADLIRENDPQMQDPSAEAITQQIFRRSMQIFNPDTLTRCTIDGKTDGCMIDRESRGDEDRLIALFRFFLEPLQVPVDKWSMSNATRSIERNKTYTFADSFWQYTDRLQSELTMVLMQEQMSTECEALADASKAAFARFGVEEIVNDFVSVASVNSTVDLSSSGCPSGFIDGKMIIQDMLTNISSNFLHDLVIEVKELANGNLLLLPNGETGGVGTRLIIPKENSFSDGELSPVTFEYNPDKEEIEEIPGESVNIQFEICLKNEGPFTFDVLGIVR